jgi:cell division protein FtsI (penicillin-binding protein 3)
VAIDPTIAKGNLFNAGLDSLSKKLSAFYKDKSASAYKRMIKDARLDNKRYLVVNRKQIGYQGMQEMSNWPIFRAGRLGGGVIFEKVEKRYQPFKSLASRTVGFINADDYGAGIEYSFNSQLKGKDGKALFQRLAGGSWKPVFDAEDVKPENGLDVYTTLDVNIQDVAETALLRQLIDREAEFGSVSVIKVETATEKITILRLGIKEIQSQGPHSNYFPCLLCWRKIISASMTRSRQGMVSTCSITEQCVMLKMVAMAPSPFGKLLKSLPM